MLFPTVFIVYSIFFFLDRGSLHVHGLLWLVGFENIIKDLIESKRASDREDAHKQVSEAFAAALKTWIATEVNLPEQDMAVAVTCPTCQSKLEAPSSAKLAELRRGCAQIDPKILTCANQSCKSSFGCQEMLHRAVASAIKRTQPADGKPLPELSDTTGYRQYIAEKVWKMQLEAPSSNPEHEQVWTALLQFCNQEHLATHTHSCFKKSGQSSCRFNMPQAPSSTLDITTSADVFRPGVVITEKRDPANLYTTPTSPDLTRIFTCNTNVKYVISMMIAYYLGAYITKHSQENATAHANVVHSFAQMENKKRAAAQQQELFPNRPTVVHEFTRNTAASTERSGSTSSSTSDPLAPSTSTSSSSQTAPSESSSTSVNGEQHQVQHTGRTEHSWGLGKTISATYAFTKGETVAAQPAAFYLAGGRTFTFSHDFETVPLAQGQAFLNKEPIRCKLNRDNNLVASVHDYVFRFVCSR